MIPGNIPKSDEFSPIPSVKTLGFGYIMVALTLIRHGFEPEGSKVSVIAKIHQP